MLRKNWSYRCSRGGAVACGDGPGDRQGRQGRRRRQDRRHSLVQRHGNRHQGADRKELGDDGFMVGPTSADPALQVRAIEDLIAQGVNVIGVVPNDATCSSRC